jgi:hypothetical protein
MAKKPLTEVERKIKHYTPQTINYAFENSISFSQYSMFRRCPHQWYLNYAKGLGTFPQSIETVFGTSMHEVLQTYLDTMYNTSGVAAEDIDVRQLFNDRFREVYKKEYDKTKTHFSSADEMREYFEDGIAILEFFKKNRRKYFSTRNVKLLGIEIPLVYPITKKIFVKGYIDFVLYDIDLDKIYIFDIKTSMYGWNDKNKKDELKTSQLVLYKEFFAKQYQVDIDKIEVQFFIVKRKLYKSEFTIPRIQTFEPASGKVKRKKVMDGLHSFITEAYGDDAKPLVKKHYKNVGKHCTYCLFNKTEHCDKINQ